MKTINFDEAKQSQLPFVELLLALGYKYISTEELARQRDHDNGYHLLRDIAHTKLMEINSYEHKGETYKFSKKDVAEAVSELENIPYNGLIDTSQDIYHTIMPLKGGKTIKVFHDGRYESKSFRFIDFETPENNDFHVAVEVPVSGKSQNIRPDIVVYINGIPFAVIENKKSSVEVSAAIDQMVRNQSATHSPRFFTYPQLLVATNGKEVRYGTTGTPQKFYANWKEKDLQLDEQNQKVNELIAKPIEAQEYTQILADLNGATKSHKQLLERTPTEQDRFVLNVFEPSRLLDLTRNYILYDAGIKKVMRYQQYFAINKALKRVETIEQTDHDERRKGGIIWHTQGSGKSLTMVMFVKALIEDPNIENPRMLIVTDRKDLDRQIKDTFINAGLKKNVKQAKSGENLLELIKSRDSSVITTLVHKFQTAGKKRAGFVDTDKNLFVLIDEAHRTQHGDANIEMNRTIPNACYIAFTGTPLLKDQKSNNKFGEFIDKYTIDDALDDKIVLPLIYEGRFVDLHQDKQEIDRLTDRITEDLTDTQKKQLQKNIEKNIIKDNPKRITEIAYDIERHFVKQFQGTGLKAQIVAPSKYSAVMMQRCFNDRGNVHSAVILSDENGMIPEDDEYRKEVDAHLKKIKENYQTLQKYEESIIENFKHNDEGVEIIIVVDKLLTGFDAPRNTVLYLARELKDHNLLQAIARVNRLYDNPSLPKTAGFIIDYSENAQNIHTAMQLFGNYDEDDVKGALVDVNQKINELQQRYGELHDVFNGVVKDDEAYLQHLSDEPTRKEFYEALNGFIKEMADCMTLREFANEFDQIDIYRMELKKFEELRKSAKLQYGERLEFNKYKLQLRKIIDENVKAEEAELLTKEIDITNKELFDEALETLGSDASKAEAIAAQTTRTITEQFEEKDPEMFQRFSKKIGDITEAMRAKKLADIEALKQLKLIRDEALNREDDTLPSSLADIPGAGVLYRNLQESIPVDSEKYQDAIKALAAVLADSVKIDWWKNHEMKRVIRNNIDDFVYDELKINQDMELSNDQVEHIVNAVMDLAENNYELFSVNG